MIGAAALTEAATGVPDGVVASAVLFADCTACDSQPVRSTSAAMVDVTDSRRAIHARRNPRRATDEILCRNGTLAHVIGGRTGRPKQARNLRTDQAGRRRWAPSPGSVSTVGGFRWWPTMWCAAVAGRRRR